RSMTPRPRSTTPARASPRTVPRLSRSVAQGCDPAGDTGGLRRHRCLCLSLCLLGELRHPSPRVEVTLAGVTADMGDHVDVGGLAAEVAGPRVLLRDIPEWIE